MQVTEAVQAREATECPFCQETRSPSSFCRGLSRVLWESDELVVLPTLGPLAQAHVLFIPKLHVRSFADLADAPQRQFYRHLASLSRSLTAVFGPTVAFEHGLPASQAGGGCGVSHAHMHVVSEVPLELSLPIDDVATHWMSIDAPNWLARSALGVRRDCGYFLVSPPDGNRYVCSIRSAPSQYLRRWLGMILEIPAWDWRTASPNETLEQVRRLSSLQVPDGMRLASRAAAVVL
jgi:diadenosine tetraphosphate (Ap4A) HIT family hydrolase